ncbi:hypothetical protein ACFQL0_02535 [Haloplanus litoreus]|uniref:DUF7537 family lipoprotein n=1 Tax=Haloplanus litoreus TaxID=767515 RepID=UPI00360B2199
MAGQTDGDDSTPDLTDPEAALREAGSFRVTWQYAGVDTSGVRSEVNHEYAVDLRAERSLTVTSSTRDGRSDGGTSEQFVSDGITRAFRPVGRDDVRIVPGHRRRGRHGHRPLAGPRTAPTRI